MSDKGYVLPDVVDPGRFCVRVMVPQDMGHILAFAGQLWELAQWWTWERDEARTGKDAAAVWRDIMESVWPQLSAELLNCMEGEAVDVRQNDEQPCILEKLVDGEWVQFADLRTCAPRIRYNPTRKTFEYSVDDIGWYEFPEGPYTDDTQYQPAPPPRTEERNVDKLCQAASNSAEFFEQFYNSVASSLAGEAISQISVFGDIADFLTLFLSFTQTVGAYLAAIGEIILLEASYQANEYTQTVWDNVRCLLLDVATLTDDVVTYDFNAFQSGLIQLNIDTGVDTYQNIALLLVFIGGDGLNTTGVADVGDATDECNDCQWCYEWDFTQGDELGWEPAQKGPPHNTAWAVWEDTGWGEVGASQNLSECIVLKGHIGAYIQTIKLTMSEANNPGTSLNALMIATDHVTRDDQNGFDLYQTAGAVSAITYTVPAGGYMYFGDVQLGWTRDRNRAQQFLPVLGKLIKIRVTGVGANPFGEDNC